MQELTRARTLAVDTDVGTKNVEDDKKLLHLLIMVGVLLTWWLEFTALSVAVVHLRVCAGKMHVERGLIGSTDMVAVRSLIEMVIATATGVRVAGGKVTGGSSGTGQDEKTS